MSPHEYHESFALLVRRIYEPICAILASSMPIINGNIIAQKILNQLKARLEKERLSPAYAKASAGRPTLAIVAVGFHEPSYFYFRKIEQMAAKVGITVKKYLFSSRVSRKKIIGQIQKLNQDSHVSGILLQFPLPKHLQKADLLAKVSPQKDADGYHPAFRQALLNGKPKIMPPTYAAILEILKSTGKKLAKARAVILTKSETFGQPLKALLKRKGFRASIILLKNKKIPDLKQVDIVITALGSPHFIQESRIKKGAIVIDLGYARKNKKMTGDCAIPATSKIPSFFTPVPNGVGPVTVAMLLKNVVQLAQEKKQSK